MKPADPSSDSKSVTDSPAGEPRVHMRPLGALGENVSAFGLGCGPLAAARDHGDWEGTLRAAQAAGITVIDAAPRMLRQHSEEMLGRVIPSFRDDLFLSTRCTPLDGEPFDTSEAAVRAQLESSLKRLRTDRIDLYQVHDVETANPARLLDVTLPALVAARERGEVRYIGASGDALELLREIVITFPVDAILSYARLDLANCDLTKEVLPAAEERGVAVVNASPLHMGLLGDTRQAKEAVAADRSIGHAAERAFELAAEAGSELPHLALEFAAQHPWVSTTLVGCANPDEVRTNVRAFERPPTDRSSAAIQKIRDAFSETLL